MNWTYIVAYLVVGYILCALLYYLKCNEIDGHKIENKDCKAFILFLFWPVFSILAILLIPFSKHDDKNKKER